MSQSLQASWQWDALLFLGVLKRFFNAVSRVATPADPRVVPSENKQIKSCYLSSLVHVNSVQCIIISAFTTVQGFTVCAKKLVEVSFVYLPWAKQKVQHMLD